MGVLGTLMLFIPSSSHISELFIPCFNVILPVILHPAGVWLFIIYLESPPHVRVSFPYSPPVMMQLYKDYPSSLSACFSFSFSAPVHASLCSTIIPHPPHPHPHPHPLLALNFSIKSLLILLILLLPINHVFSYICSLKSC